MPRIKVKKEYLTREEVDRLLFHLPRLQDQILFQFVYDTGCRISEAIMLKPEDIDFDRQEVKLPALKRKDEEYKLVTISKPMAETLKAFCKRKPKGQLLFPISRHMAYYRLKTASLDAGIEAYPHLLRDSFAVTWAKAGGDLVRLQRQLGHKCLSTTTDRYLRYSTADIKAERERLKI